MRTQYVDNVSLSDIARVLVSVVGIWLFCSSMIPQDGRGRLAEILQIGTEIHATSVVLQVAPWKFVIVPANWKWTARVGLRHR